MSIQADFQMPPWMVPSETPSSALIAGVHAGTALAQVANQRTAIAQQGNIALQQLALDRQKIDMTKQMNDSALAIQQNQLEDHAGHLEAQADIGDAMSNITDYNDPDQTKPVFDIFAQHPLAVGGPTGSLFLQNMAAAKHIKGLQDLQQTRSEGAARVAGIKADASMYNSDAKLDATDALTASREKLRTMKTEADKNLKEITINGQLSLQNVKNQAALDLWVKKAERVGATSDGWNSPAEKENVHGQIEAINKSDLPFDTKIAKIQDLTGRAQRAILGSRSQPSEENDKAMKQDSDYQTIHSKDDYDQIPDGTPFIWNGKTAIKGEK